MHNPNEVPSRTSIDAAADLVLDAFVDSFVHPYGEGVPPDRWLARLIEQLEDARLELTAYLVKQDNMGYKRNLERSVKRIERVLAQLYEEQLQY